jgi:hypothetical protein
MRPDVYGGATIGGSQFAQHFGVGNDSNIASPAILGLTHPGSYFGFWRSAGDQHNRVVLHQGSTVYATARRTDPGVGGGGHLDLASGSVS